jgi:hypothetical protein
MLFIKSKIHTFHPRLSTPRPESLLYISNFAILGFDALSGVYYSSLLLEQGLIEQYFLYGIAHLQRPIQ